MKIVAGSVEKEITGIYQENHCQNGIIRDVLYITLTSNVSTDELQSILSNNIAVVDDSGLAAKMFNGFNCVKAHTISLIRETDAEKEISELRAQLEAMRQAQPIT